MHSYGAEERVFGSLQWLLDIYNATMHKTSIVILLGDSRSFNGCQSISNVEMVVSLKTVVKRCSRAELC